MPQTIQERFAAAQFGLGGVLREILAADPSRTAMMNDDFIFDAMVADCYANGALPAVGAVIPDAGLLNLIPGVMPNLGRNNNHLLTLTPNNLAKKPTFSGKGWEFDGGVAKAWLDLKKNGAIDGIREQPANENWFNHVVMCYAKMAAPGGSGAPYEAPMGSAWGNTTSQYLGWQFNVNAAGAAAAPSTFPTGSGGPGVAVGGPGIWFQIAAHYTFSGDHSTVTIRNYVNGLLTATSAAIATTNMVGGGSGGLKVGSSTGYLTWYGEIARVRRAYQGAMLNADIDTLVKADYDYKMPILNAA